MVYLVARFWGSLLPYLAEISIACDSRAGMRTALLYLANILGSASGSVLTGFVLMNFLGLVAIGAALVLAGIACILFLIVTLDIPERGKAPTGGLGCGNRHRGGHRQSAFVG